MNDTSLAKPEADWLYPSSLVAGPDDDDDDGDAEPDDDEDERDASLHYQPWASRGFGSPEWWLGS